MGGSSSKAPQITPQQRALDAKSSSLMDAQMESMERQEKINEQERKKIMREESTTAAAEAEARSNYRRRGALDGGLVTAQGFGGYRGRDMRGGAQREFTPQAAPQSLVPSDFAGGGDSGDGSQWRGGLWESGGQVFAGRDAAREHYTKTQNAGADAGDYGGGWGGASLIPRRVGHGLTGSLL